MAPFAPHASRCCTSQKRSSDAFTTWTFTVSTCFRTLLQYGTSLCCRITSLDGLWRIMRFTVQTCFILLISEASHPRLCRSAGQWRVARDPLPARAESYPRPASGDKRMAGRAPSLRGGHVQRVFLELVCPTLMLLSADTSDAISQATSRDAEIVFWANKSLEMHVALSAFITPVLTSPDWGSRSRKLRAYSSSRVF